MSNLPQDFQHHLQNIFSTFSAKNKVSWLRIYLGLAVDLCYHLTSLDDVIGSPERGAAAFDEQTPQNVSAFVFVHRNVFNRFVFS